MTATAGPPSRSAGRSGPRAGQLVAERIRRLGPLPFDDFLELALYHPEAGFYGAGRGAGRRADFLTSPEVGPLFGAVLARALDRWWEGLGRPDPFLVVEGGAGTGALAASVLAARPGCSRALHYVLVERSEGLRDEQGGRLPLEPARQVLGPIVAAAADPDEGRHPAAGTGPVVTALEELPAGAFTAVVIANELLDNLPFRLLERGGETWFEVRVGTDTGDRLTEVLVEAPAELAAAADRFAPDAPDHGRVPLQRAAASWLRDALRLVRRGRVVVIDYASTTPQLAVRPWSEWVRTYRSHGRGGGPLDDPGDQDVTCEVAADQLAAVQAVTADRSQEEFLRDHGIDGLVADARAAWQERAAVGDLEAMKARSRINEGKALTDPSGLGAFRVLEWATPS